MSENASPDGERVCAAEVIAALSLATDLATGLPFEHGLESTLAAMRLAERLGVDAETEQQTYYACLLFHVGCTADAHVAADLFGESGVLRHLGPAMFGSQRQAALATLRALAPQVGPAPARALGVARKLPRAVGAYRRHVEAACEVATMLTDRLGLPPDIQGLFAGFTERWDGKGELGLARGEEIPLAVRIAHVARDATVQRMIAGPEVAAQVVRGRAGHAFDPAVAACLADGIEDIFAGLAEGSAWDRVLAAEPAPGLSLEGEAIDRALTAMGDFADLASPYLAGHSAGVAQVAGAAADRCGVDPRGRAPRGMGPRPRAGRDPAGDLAQAGAAGAGRVGARAAARLPLRARARPLAVPRRAGVRRHRAPRAPGRIGLPPRRRRRGAAAAGAAARRGRRVLRHDRAAGASRAAVTGRAAETLGREASAGRLDVTAVEAVLEAAGQPVPRMERPAGLTEREAQVVGLLARGLQTKQVARALGISAKTTDRHIQNAYAKIGVSTRAAAALFAMEHGLAAWGELPIGGPPGRA